MRPLIRFLRAAGLIECGQSRALKLKGHLSHLNRSEVVGTCSLPQRTSTTM